jgi:peptidoglycan hydrolase-like protein with peptidoglycan-binding domain
MTITTAAKPAVGILCGCVVAGLLSVATAGGPPSEGAAGGDAAVLLAADESGDQSAGEASSDEEAAVTISADDSAVTAQSDADSTAANAQENDPFAAPGPADTKATRNGPSVAFAQAGVLAPADVLVAAPVGQPTPVIAPLPAAALQSFDFKYQPVIAPPQIGDFRYANAAVRATASGASPAMLKLEAEYWALKAQGLQKKVEAIEAKVAEHKSLEEVGRQPHARSAILELEAEKELTLAEVKFCQLNGERVKDALREVDAGALRSGATGPQVTRLQVALNEQVQPSPKLDVDGDFGPLTEEAVKRFQQQRGLAADGVARVETLAALGLIPTPVMAEAQAMQAARAAEQSAKAAVQAAAADAATAIQAAKMRIAAPVPQIKPRDATPESPAAEQNPFGGGYGGGYGEMRRGGFGGGEAYGGGEANGGGGDIVVVPKQLIEKLEALAEANKELSKRVEALQRGQAQRSESEESEK